MHVQDISELLEDDPCSAIKQIRILLVPDLMEGAIAIESAPNVWENFVLLIRESLMPQ